MLHDQDDDLGRPKARKKDTRRWCRGKVGVEHKTVCMTAKEAKSRSYLESWRYLVCTVCGRELETYFGNQENVPSWVTK